MKEFNKKNYVIIKSAISEETADVAKDYFALKAQILDTFKKNKYISPFNKDHGLFGDHQVNKGFCSYGDPLSDSLTTKLKPIFEKATGLKLNENYSYMRIYLKGEELTRHKDRDSCEISGTLCIDDNDWPIYLEPDKKKGKITNTGYIPGFTDGKAVHLKKGDLMIYRGCDLEHWRDPNPFDKHFQIFVHYNNTKTTDQKYDGRPHMGLPNTFQGGTWK